jgi:hypothetical protein
MTVTLADPLTVPALAVTVYSPVASGAVYSPALEIVPPFGVTDHVMPLATAWPNWSVAVAVNCCWRFCLTVALDGATVIAVIVWSTTTLTVDVVVSMPSLTATWIVYAPARPKVTLAFLAALVPLALNVGAGAPLGAAVVDQVYVSTPSPDSSAPTTLRSALVPMTWPGLALGGVAIVGGLLTRLRFASGMSCLVAIPGPLKLALIVSDPVASKYPSLNECQPASRMTQPLASRAECGPSLLTTSCPPTHSFEPSSLLV